MIDQDKFSEDIKPREIEILRLMAEGLTNREIGERLYIGVETVRWYAKQIYSKLDVSGREEAAAKAQTLGLLDGATAEKESKPAPPKHNLPTQLTSFIGREKQQSEIIELLHETRLLTLTGPGGTGKTRLSIRVAEGMTDEFDDGIYFIDLAPLTDGGLVAKAIADGLQVVESGREDLLDTLKRAIEERQILLLIDNFEHVLDGASVVPELLIDSPNLKVLVTSREALRLSGEQTYIVPSLTLPSKRSDDLQASEAVGLFVQRAQASRRTFQLTAENAADVISICQRLDGMPLAIELAAARIRSLSPQALLKRLDSRLNTLTGGARDLPARQQTLRQTIDWSFDLLTDDEQKLFARMAVFRGGRSLEAIEAVCGDDLTADILDGIDSLVDKSLLRVEVNFAGEPRFIMLETIQEYALERLEASGEASTFRRRHAQYFMELAERAAPELRLANQEWWYTKLDIEQSNLRAAMAWAISGGDAKIGLRTVAALRDYWWYQSLHAEGWRWCQHALEFIDEVPDKIRADILITASVVGYFQGELSSSERFVAEAHSIYRALNDPHGVAWALSLFTNRLAHDSEISKFIESVKEALEIMRNLNDLPGQAMMLNALGLVLNHGANYEAAYAVFEECVEISRKTGERRREVLALGSLGLIAFYQGLLAEARRLYFDMIYLAKELSFFAYGIHNALWLCVAIFHELDKLDVAVTLYAAAKAQEQRRGQSVYPFFYNSIYTKNIEELQAELERSSPQLQIAYDMGRKMSLEEAVAFALEALES